LTDPLTSVRESDDLLTALSNRRPPPDTDPVVQALGALTRFVDQTPPALPPGVRPDLPARSRVRARVAAAVVVGVLVSSSGVAAAVTGDPLRPVRYVVTHVGPTSPFDGAHESDWDLGSPVPADGVAPVRPSPEHVAPDLPGAPPDVSGTAGLPGSRPPTAAPDKPEVGREVPSPESVAADTDPVGSPVPGPSTGTSTDGLADARGGRPVEVEPAEPIAQPPDADERPAGGDDPEQPVPPPAGAVESPEPDPGTHARTVPDAPTLPIGSDPVSLVPPGPRSGSPGPDADIPETPALPGPLPAPQVVVPPGDTPDVPASGDTAGSAVSPLDPVTEEPPGEVPSAVADHAGDGGEPGGETSVR
jgi:hypothetical protein